MHSILDRNGRPHDPQVLAAFEEASFLLHSSSSGVSGQAKLESWRRATGKPYGIFGVSVWDIGAGLKETLSGASFVFTRETESLANVRAAGVCCMWR